MKKLDQDTYLRIETWILQNARQLEVAMWKYFFHNGSKDEVLNVLALYQNEDGGFGQALEPDNWNLNSTPSTTLFALHILKSIDYYDRNHRIYQGILRYLSSGKDQKEYGWMFNTPSNDEFPHAPWWGYNEEANKVESVGITAEFSAYLLRFADTKSQLNHTALDFARTLIDKIMQEEHHGDMGVSGYIPLVEAITDMGVEGFPYEAMAKRIGELVTKGIEHDVSKWKYYGYRPSNYIPNPRSPFYARNQEIVEVELDYLVDTLPDHDVWPITWTWFDNNVKYAKEFAVSEVRWKAIKAIEKICFLQEFGRINLKDEKINT